MSYFQQAPNNTAEKEKQVVVKQQEDSKILIQEKLDLNSSKVNDRDEIFSEVGPKKRSLSFSGSKGDCFLPQDKQKMSLSMFGDDEIAENAFR